MADSQFPDIVESVRRGQEYGTKLRLQRETEQRRGRLSELAQLAYGAQPMQRQELVRQAIGVDPGAGFELDQSLQKAGEAKMQELVNSARMFISAPEASRPNLMQSLRPRFEELGLDVPDYTPENAAQFLENAKAFVASHGGAGGDVPTGFRQLDLSAQAAGYTPGTPEYQNFFRVAGGIQGRAPSGGFGLEFIPGVGFVRKNPRAGVVDVYDPQRGDFTPIGTGAELNVGGPAGAVTDVGQITPDVGQPAPVGSITLEGASPQQNQQIETVSRFMAAQGIPQPQIDEWVASQAAAMGGQPAALAPVVAPRAPSPAAQRFGDITTRTPEQQAFLTEQEKERARQEAFGRGTELEAERAFQTASAKARAELEADLGSKDVKRVRDAAATLDLLDEAEGLLPGATGSELGRVLDRAAAAFGKSTPGARATSQLNLIASQLVSKVPRFEGPQSNIDVQFYREAAGDLANPNIPVQTRLAALQTMRRLNQKYSGGGQSAGGARPAAKTPKPGAWGIRRVK